MDAIYEQIRDQAIKIAARYPEADFYRDYPKQVEFSSRFFEADSMVCELRDFVAQKIDNDFGHGMDHADKVAKDAGALMAIEGAQNGYRDPFLTHRVRMAQCAGLLHDIKRKHEKHAKEGALYAGKVLSDYPFSDDDVADICSAIENHEAFGKTGGSKTSEGALLSNCLYDSDKFRWGPDNFTHTVWDMVSYANISVKKFMGLYPKGISFLDKIKDTFRTPTGKIYGPQFIDLGLSIGEALYGYIRTEFDAYF
jgi:hypothetical protein